MRQFAMKMVTWATRLRKQKEAEFAKWVSRIRDSTEKNILNGNSLFCKFDIEIHETIVRRLVELLACVCV